MKHYSTTFFCDSGRGPKVHIEIEDTKGLKKGEEPSRWPVTLKLTATGDKNDNPVVTFFISTREDLQAFRASVTKAFRAAVKEAK